MAERGVRSVLLAAHAYGGMWTFAADLAKGLAASGIDVALAMLGAPLNREQRAEVRRMRVDLYESQHRLEWMDDWWKDLELSGEWLLYIEEMLNPDIVHLNGYVHGALPWCSGVVMTAHGCRISWHEAVRDEPLAPCWNHYLAAYRCGLNAADLVVAPSRAMLDNLKRRQNLAGGRVIPVGRDPALFQPAAKEPVIVTAGRLWDPAKNVAMLDRIATQLSWPVLAIGDRHGPDGRSMRFERLTLLGRLPARRLASWLGRSAIFVAPAIYEPADTVILEAALSGCALVLSDLPPLREQWDGTALFVPPGDADALTAVLTRLTADTELRERLGVRARARALMRGADAMVEAYRTAYADVLAARAKDQFAEIRQLTA